MASPPARTKAQDAADLKKALVTARDLGSPWVQPKAVPTVKGKKNEICRGHVSATRKVPVTAEASVGLTEGRGAGKNIASFSLSTLPDENESALSAAYQDDEVSCSTYQDGSGLYVVRSIEGPSSSMGPASSLRGPSVSTTTSRITSSPTLGTTSSPARAAP